MLLIFTLLPHFDALHHWWLPAHVVRGAQRDEPVCRAHACHAHLCLLPLIGVGGAALGSWSYWFPIVIIGIIGAAHQSWSANVYSVVGDMFPKSAVATVTGIGGMSGGIGCLLFNVCSGMLFTYSKETQMEFWASGYRSRLYDSVYGSVVGIPVELGDYQTLGAALPTD